MPVDEATKARCNILSNEIISAAIEVHRHMGPGLLESAYRTCLCHELGLRNISYRCEIPLDVEYKGLLVPQAYRIDIWVDGLVIVEIKSVDKLIEVHEAQLLTYLKFTKCWLGLLLNFNVKMMKTGIKRLVM